MIIGRSVIVVSCVRLLSFKKIQLHASTPDIMEPYKNQGLRSVTEEKCEGACKREEGDMYLVG